MDDAIIIECWKYMNEETSSEVKYIKEDDVSAWLEQSPRDNRRPCAGLRLIHRFQPTTIKHKFGLPDVFLHVDLLFQTLVEHLQQKTLGVVCCITTQRLSC